MVCNDVEIKPVFKELTGELMPRGANRAPDARLDIHARGFWERQRSASLDRIANRDMKKKEKRKRN